MVPRCYPDPEAVMDATVDRRRPLNSGDSGERERSRGDREPRLTLWERNRYFLASNNDVDRGNP